MDETNTPPAEVSWEGDSLEVLCSFPVGVRRYLGADLRRVQVGESPLDSRPMKSIGRKVFELRQRDERGWYRLVYMARIENTVYVLHCFEKRSGKTLTKDLNTARERLKLVMQRLRESKSHGQKRKK